MGKTYDFSKFAKGARPVSEEEAKKKWQGASPDRRMRFVENSFLRDRDVVDKIWGSLNDAEKHEVMRLLGD